MRSGAHFNLSKVVDTWYIFTDDACEGDSKDLKVGGIDGYWLHHTGSTYRALAVNFQGSG